MRILLQQYQRTNVLQPATLVGSQTISLPLPANLVDITSVRYSEEENSALAGSFYNASSALHEHTGQASGALGFLGSPAWQQQFAGSVAIGAANAGGSRFGSIFAATRGIAGNPFLTVEFQSPRFKQHTFSWIFSPNDAGESATLKLIIDTLRKNMLPNLMGGPGVFLGYPSVFTPMIVPNEQNLYVFKPCVIDSIEVDYAPSRVPAFYTGTKQPAAVAVSIHFLQVLIDLQETYGTSL